MTDHFSVLHQPRRPWLDAEALKEAFHREAAAHHPDVNDGGDASHFVALNAAYSVLREPASRLRHLLELEATDRLTPSQAIPPSLGDLFMKVAEFRQAYQSFRRKEASASSALGLSLLVEDQIAVTTRGRVVHAELIAAHDNALRELLEADSDWQRVPRPDDIFGRLGALHQLLAFLEKWPSQIAEDLWQFQSELASRNKDHQEGPVH